MCELPSTSQAAGLPLLEETLILDKKEEEEQEISRLEAETAIKEQEAIKLSAQETEPKIEFKCENCDMEELVHYYGQTPEFAWGISFLEDTYVMRDPFQPPPYPRKKPKAEYFIALGAKCRNCARTVCKDAECSFFYTHTYCLKCAQSQKEMFPIEVQTKLTRQLAALNQ